MVGAIKEDSKSARLKQSMQLLCILGCTEMQGFLFSPAISVTEIRRLLLAHRGRTVSAA